jgi:23S rRNA pseudouridine1911/1915/1917 synthase
MRLDQYLVKEFGYSRAYIQKLIANQAILVNGHPAKASYKLTEDDQVSADIPPPKKPEIVAENIPLDIVYEDQDLLAINKPAGMVTHPACGHYTGTLVNALMTYCEDLSGIGGVARPGIIHRLDKDTTGLILVAKHDKSHQGLARQFQQRTIEKRYRALVSGDVSSEAGTINQPLGRNPQNRLKVIVTNNPAFKPRDAVTHYEVIERRQSTTLLEVKPETGRTHQIRVHLAFVGHPIQGDPLYGKNKTGGLKLQAYFLRFLHPISKNTIKLEIPTVF